MSPAPTTTATPAATVYGFHCDIDDKDFVKAVARVTAALKTALGAEPDIGLLLPCDVVVREEADGRLVVGQRRACAEEYEKRKALLDRDAGARI